MVSKDKKEKPTIDVIHLAFEKFDIDGDGKISLPEFKQAIQDYEQKNPELKSK
jgi:Ca2+-binding EF-hand superfamily protein